MFIMRKANDDREPEESLSDLEREVAKIIQQGITDAEKGALTPPVKDAIGWVVNSSQDPAKISLTVKGALVAFVPQIVAVAGLLHLPIASDNLTETINQVTQGLQGLLMLVGSLIFAWGIARKLKSSYWPK